MRIVGYEVRGDISLEMEILLERGKASKIITEGDCSCTMIWFEGKPGPAMRAFRDEMVALLSAPRVASGTEKMDRLIRKYARTRARRESAR